MTRDEILQIVAGLDKLPKLPQVAMKLMEISMDDQTSAKDIADIVMEDPAITAYLLKLINSPFYGLREKVTTVSHGIALLGVEVVKNVVLSLAVMDIMNSKTSGNPALKSFWEHSLYTAIAARLFAQQVGYPAPEKVFIAGLLADLGSLILWEIDPLLYRKVARKEDGGKGDRSVAEKALFGVDHTEAGVALAQLWNLPEEYIGVIALHHNLDVLTDLEDDGVKILGEFVHLGSVVASIFVLGEDGFKTVYLKSMVLNLFGLQEKVVDSLLLRTSRNLEALLVDTELGLPSKKSYFRILQDSNKKLGENNLKLTRSLMEHERLKQARIELMNMVAEDMKSPLAAIIGYSSHLVHNLPADRTEIEKLVREIYQSGKNALTLLKESAKLMDMEEEHLQVSPSRSNMEKMLLELLEMVAERAEKKEIAIVSDFRAPLPLLTFDEHKLGHALAHLLNLAMVLAGERGKVLVKTDIVTVPGSQSPTSAGASARLFELRIDEHGDGFQDSRRAALRERLDEPKKLTTVADHLTDSGLYLARSIIQAHGGQMHIDRKADGNVGFTIHMPMPWLAEMANPVPSASAV
ncbi:MAG: HDOD domain-containing protein [Deltaproteobacteria bacterium]|nr:HDOD domain-containing protein [Candidatus Anaeroferrophillus wilburensis]MBN2889311.1 HDOD domain-containing protein [Deltaproteobacteria bacterium]